MNREEVVADLRKLAEPGDNELRNIIQAMLNQPRCECSGFPPYVRVGLPRGSEAVFCMVCGKLRHIASSALPIG